MSPVFSDTCYYIALCNKKDTWNAAALATSKICHAPVVTTDYILLELGNYLCNPDDRDLFLRIVDMLHADPNTTVIPASPKLLDAGLTLFRQRRDKAWSLTDCISFSIMKELGVQAALSCDRHFEQAGFHLLMKK